MHAVGFGRRHGKGKHLTAPKDNACLTVPVPSATVTDSWKSLFNLRLTPTSNPSTGAGLGKSYRITGERRVTTDLFPETINLCMRRCKSAFSQSVDSSSLFFDMLFRSLKSWSTQLTFTRIMLIDLYERPYSPEASRSRAFIDRILALSGPDGGVVGGEDGISTQRPLKDGGREAWDMIRRLRQKAWQKAGLNPQMLWTEQDQIQAGIASPAGETRSSRGPFYSGTSSVPGSPGISAMPSRQPTAPDRQLSDFNRMFYNMTRSHVLPSPAVTSASVKPSPLRYSYQLPPPTRTSAPLPTPQYNPTPAAVTLPAPDILPAPGPIAPSPPAAPSLGSPSSPHTQATPSTAPIIRPEQPLSSITASPGMPFIDPVSSNPPPMGVPTPPSMVDPNLNFDWDQWDAVFGQHLPVADELMELDPVSGLDFANLGFPAANNNTGLPFNGLSASASPGNGNLPPAWTDSGSGNPGVPSSDWTGYC